MRRLIRSLLVVAVFALFCGPAQATSSLSFDGGDYLLNMEIGHVERPVIASITVHRPGDSKGVVLRGNFVAEVFDTNTRQMRVIYKGGDPRVPPFTLVVKGEAATLSIDGKTIRSAFSWFM